MATVLFSFAHPDDETFICGGTLAKLASEGHRVVVISATRGEMGRRMGVPPIATRESIAKIREVELREACDALSVARLEFLNLRDKTLEIIPPATLAKLVLDVMQEERPDAVVTFHDPLGGHPDHCAMGRATTRAFLDYVDAGPIALGHERLFYIAWSDDASHYRSFEQPVEGVVTVQVHDVLHQKLAAFRAHQTQSGLNRELWGRDEHAVRRLSSKEYFVHTLGSKLKRYDSLLDR